MLKFAMLFVLSFGSVAAVANAAQPMEHEVFANAGALSVERLTAEQMQETEGEVLPILAVKALVVVGRPAAAFVAGYATSYFYEKYSPTINPILENVAQQTADATVNAFTIVGESHKLRTEAIVSASKKLASLLQEKEPEESKPKESKPKASSSKRGSSGGSAGYGGPRAPTVSPIINYRRSYSSKPRWRGVVRHHILPYSYSSRYSSSSRSGYGRPASGLCSSTDYRCTS